MNESKVVCLLQKDEIDDPLTDILRSGARRLLQQAVEAEFAAFLAAHTELELPDGRRRVVRHGHDPVRPVQTGIGSVEVAKPKARDRGAATADERIRHASSILPKWARRTKSLDVLLPALYLRGVSTGDFQEVLTALPGEGAPNLSPAVIARLKSEWEDEYRRWQGRDQSARRYVYVWVDGVCLLARMEPQAESMLVFIGATPEGKNELPGFQTGMRESAQSWKELLVDLKARGLSIAPEVAVGDGANGFGEGFRRQPRRRKVLAAGTRRPAVSFGLGFDPADGRKPRHRRAILVAFGKQPVDIAHDGMAARLHPAMTGVRGFEAVGDGRLGAGEKSLDILQRRSPVDLESEQVIAVAGAHPPAAFSFLTIQCSAEPLSSLSGARGPETPRSPYPASEAVPSFSSCHSCDPRLVCQASLDAGKHYVHTSVTFMSR